MPKYIKSWPEEVSLKFCQHLINRFEVDKRVQSDPQPDYSKRSFLVISNLSDWKEECDQLNSIVKQNTKRYFSLPKKYRSITQTECGNDGFLIARYEPGDTCILHVDGQCAVPPQNQLRLATFLLYLNTLKKGGETVFPLQETKMTPEAGKIVIFPPMHTHPHEVVASRETRYILQTWITDPKFLIVEKGSQEVKPRRRFKRKY